MELFLEFTDTDIKLDSFKYLQSSPIQANK